MKRKLKMGMIGGGPGAMIGDVHRKAASLDGKIELVAGAFSSDIKKSKQLGKNLHLDSNRIYKNYEEMIQKESMLDKDERIDFAAVTVPNNLHFPIARDFLKAGFHVMCEKPMTVSLNEAKTLKKLVAQKRLVFGLMHNYTGYPMVKLARDMVKKGKLGKVLKVVVQYPQGWLSQPIEQGKSPNKQASWRTDPKRSGAVGCMGDLGTHAENLTEYVTGLKIKEICADFTSFVKGRKLEDDGNCLLHFNNGAKGLLYASQISIGQENNLAVWVHGEKQSIEWHQEHPNYLYVDSINKATEVWKRGNDYVADFSPAAGRGTRLPFGHPEGFIEAFANIYSNFADTVNARIERTKKDPLASDFPGVTDGVRGMAFIEAVAKSAAAKQKWIKVPTT
jgi:predicted dehydrogenase